MKLIHARQLKKGEENHVYSSEHAVAQIKTALSRNQKVEGLAELRRGLLVKHDHYVLRAIERGEWILIKPEARSFDWTHFEKEYKHQKMMELLANPPPQIAPPKWIFRANDSETGEPVVTHSYHYKFPGEDSYRRTDTQGFGTLPVLSKHGKIWMELSHR